MEYYNIELNNRRRKDVSEQAPSTEKITILSRESMIDEEIKDQNQQMRVMFEQLMPEIQQMIIETPSSGPKKGAEKQIALGVGSNNDYWKQELFTIMVNNSDETKQKLEELLKKSLFHIYTHRVAREDEHKLAQAVQHDPLDLLRARWITSKRYRERQTGHKESRNIKDIDLEKAEERATMLEYIEDIRETNVNIDVATDRYLSTAQRWILNKGEGVWESRDFPTTQMFTKLDNETPMDLFAENDQEWNKLVYTSTGKREANNGFTLREITKMIATTNNPIVYRERHFYPEKQWKRNEHSKISAITQHLTKRLLEIRKEFQARIKPQWKKIKQLEKQLKEPNVRDDREDHETQRRRHHNIMISVPIVVQQLRAKLAVTEPIFIRAAPLQAFNISLGGNPKEEAEKEIEEYMQ
jgi:hypothetical protein